jgi:hypothetical protein
MRSEHNCPLSFAVTFVYNLLYKLVHTIYTKLVILLSTPTSSQIEIGAQDSATNLKEVPQPPPKLSILQHIQELQELKKARARFLVSCPGTRSKDCQVAATTETYLWGTRSIESSTANSHEDVVSIFCFWNTSHLRKTLFGNYRILLSRSHPGGYIICTF